ncbi:MAG TPA: hypothetical protein VN442_05420 [Bryobacteraceae bacterium]|nr:hypothetical protein [Bryobacteraceae bacterium]
MFLVVAQSDAAQAALRNGVYAVLGETATASEAALPYDAKYSDADRNAPRRYITLDAHSFVPLVLAAPPQARQDDRGWTLLSVTLARQHLGTLEAFTRAHLGGRVAIVLDGEIVTIHKVRSVISDGRVQVSRCHDNACQILRARLAK